MKQVVAGKSRHREAARGLQSQTGRGSEASRDRHAGRGMIREADKSGRVRQRKVETGRGRQGQADKAGR
jgi:hypothetical protein